MALARDTNGQIASVTLRLNITNTATLLAIEVDPPAVLLTSTLPLPLRVWGTYSDSLRRDLTRNAGTKYASSDPFALGVNPTNGVLNPKVNTSSPITISVTNGTVFTSLVVSIRFSNAPPSAIAIAPRK